MDVDEYVRKRHEEGEKRVETMKERYGEDYYSRIGRKATERNFQDKDKARLAAFKKWHPEWFNDKGELLAAYKEKLNG